MSYLPIPGAGCGFRAASGAYYPHACELERGASTPAESTTWRIGDAITWRNRESAIYAARSGDVAAQKALRAESAAMREG